MCDLSKPDIRHNSATAGLGARLRLLSRQRCLQWALAVQILTGCGSPEAHCPQAVADAQPDAATDSADVASVGVTVTDPCIGTFSCEVEGLCSLDPLGYCRATSELYCRASSLCHSMGMCDVDGAQCLGGPNSNCAATTDCLQQGHCTLVGHLCKATSEHDCSVSLACLKEKRCRLQSTYCVLEANSEEECLNSEGCKWSGLCSLVDGKCIAGSDADCVGSSICSSLGACTEVDGLCEVTSQAECEQSWRCKQDGACTYMNGFCRHTSQADCDKFSEIRNGSYLYVPDSLSCMYLVGSSKP